MTAISEMVMIYDNAEILNLDSECRNFEHGVHDSKNFLILSLGK